MDKLQSRFSKATASVWMRPRPRLRSWRRLVNASVVSPWSKIIWMPARHTFERRAGILRRERKMLPAPRMQSSSEPSGFPKFGMPTVPRSRPICGCERSFSFMPVCVRLKPIPMHPSGSPTPALRKSIWSCCASQPRGCSILPPHITAVKFLGMMRFEMLFVLPDRQPKSYTTSHFVWHKNARHAVVSVVSPVWIKPTFSGQWPFSERSLTNALSAFRT